MRKIGVFVCWCGSNIGGVVDVPQVVEAARAMPGVAWAVDYKYMCSEPGQELIIQAVKEHGLQKVVVASCSPRLHEATFRKTLQRAGLNPYLLEMANIREHCSWVHQHDRAAATTKAIELVRRAVAKAARLTPLQEGTIPVTRRALVIGGGIAGLQAALDIADAGFEVVLVEREPSLGGKMAMLDKTFPTLDCSACISTPKMAQAAQHPRIKVFTYAEVVDVQGYVGNFQVAVKQKPRFVDHGKCTGCGMCWEKCPTRVPSEYDLGLGQRKAIYLSFPQAVPNKPVIDSQSCRFLTSGKCGVCRKVCPTGAIDFEQKEEMHRLDVGAIVMATGYDLFPWAEHYSEYGAGAYPDVITGLHFERLVNAAGPTGGKIVRPSDGREPRSVVFVKCVGSRDEAKGKSYCSRACCMYTAKHAHQVLEKIPGAQVYIFYMDVRTAGKNYEEFYNQVQSEGAQYIRGRVSKIYQQDDQLVVLGADTLAGRPVQITADLVVLATAMQPAAGSGSLAQLVGFTCDRDGFFLEAHPKLRPVETSTAGVFLAGTCQGPKDIPDTVSQAGAAAAKAIALLARDELVAEPMVSRVEESMCSGCLECVSVCPYRAIEGITVQERSHGREVTRRVARVNTGLCQGCGACNVACRAGAVNTLGYNDEQLLAEVDALCQ